MTTSTKKKIVLKQLLLDECLPALCAQAKYFSHEAIRHWLARRKTSYSPGTLNRYMVELMADGFVFGAGRGWYSSLKSPLSLDTRTVEELVAILQKQFRFLMFSCWSTDQVRPFMQHLLTRSFLFVSAEAHALEGVRDFLAGTDFNVYLDPKKSEAGQMAHLKGKTVILRPSHSKEPPARPYAAVEKILVDLRVEAGCLRLMDIIEFHVLAHEAARQGRIQMAVMIRYAKARLLRVGDIFGSEESIIAKL